MGIERSSVILVKLEILLDTGKIGSWCFDSNEKILYKFFHNGEEIELKTDFEGLKDIEEEIQEYKNTLKKIKFIKEK